MHVLLAEDDDDAAAHVQGGLIELGHSVIRVADGEDAFALGSAEHFDIIVLDRMMPKADGIEVLRKLRHSGVSAPILLLTAMGGIGDRVDGLDAGADDYLVKPYAFAELIARVEALARRRETGSVQTVLKVGDLEMNLIARTVHREGKEIDLQPREFQLLEFLMRHAGQSVTRTMLLEKVWEYHFDPQTNVIDVHISRLRSKIDKGFDKAMLQTVRGAGYRLEA